ncbi:MAG: hypothetical protein BWY51_00314 [Parcubacteria group bacterium ADurb.Bin316]|nr:MAG: hypothetical protein BWY51_00314 [Parcubacteria group bacterium ADurb.Bin316]HOZ55705.1 hypothetical protein [bacterium]
MDCSGSEFSGILCPALKIEASPGFDSTKPWGPDNIPANQGVVSWGHCLICRHHKGHDSNRYTVSCGYDPKNIVELDLLPE